MKLPTNINIQSLKNHKWMKSFKRFTNSNGFLSFVAKAIFTLIIWAVALIPFWLYLVIRMIADPVGFWQELATVALCAIFIGWIQVILAIGAAVLTVALIFDDTI